MADFCILLNDLSPVTVKFSNNNGLRSGVKCWLFEKNGTDYTPIENDKHSGSTGNTGEFSFDLNTLSKDLEGTLLRWVINSCLFIPQVEKASVKVEFFQNGEKCKTTADNRYYGDFPNCSASSDNALQHKGQLLFTLTLINKIETSWDEML